MAAAGRMDDLAFPGWTWNGENEDWGGDHENVELNSGQCRRLHFIAPTAGDARDVMVEGESGILAISPPSFYPNYEPSKRRLTWPNGATATLFSGEEPKRLRGPQCDGIWADELASWKYPDDAWSNALMGLRLGSNPRAFVSTTPKRVQHLKDLISQRTTVITRGTTYDNRHNLAPTFLTQVIARYEGTRLGRQEINGELLEDNPKALWHHDQIDNTRVKESPELSRIVVAVDPAISEHGDEHGIVVVGKGKDNHYYILADYSTQGSPLHWASKVVTAYQVHNADRIVYEDNQGGNMVRQDNSNGELFCASQGSSRFSWKDHAGRTHRGSV